MKVDYLLKFKNLSQKEKIMLVLLIAGLIVLAFILIGNHNNSDKLAQVEIADKKEMHSQKIKQDIVQKVKKNKPREIESLLQGVGREDPFSPAKKQINLAPEQLNLVGILWDADKPLAVINDTVVAQGDMIRDKKVVKIEKETVILEEEGKEIKLRLREPALEKTTQ